ncbi:hypothetical protein TGCAST_203960 [Toxoplasma gondii CAST]|uniref:Uncharacterized protein n=1 Tax=Toxoplasma gondii CAST TaxID=943122 RepID=A0A425I383_TOXGO|nr:hypothetical protein TGCAST_203960 [Toxoplasma gondii CAST]
MAFSSSHAADSRTVDYEARRSDFKRKTPIFSNRPQSEQEWREELLRAQRSAWRVEKLEALRSQSLRELSRLAEHVPHSAANPVLQLPKNGDEREENGEEEEAERDAVEALRTADLPTQLRGVRSGGESGRTTRSSWTERMQRRDVCQSQRGEGDDGDDRSAGQDIAMGGEGESSSPTTAIPAHCSTSASRLQTGEAEDAYMQAANRKKYTRRQWQKKQRDERTVFASMLAIPKPIVVPELLLEARDNSDGQESHSEGRPSTYPGAAFLPGFSSAPEDWYVYLRPEGRRCLLVMHDGMGAIVDKRGIVRGLLNPRPFHEQFAQAQRKAVARWHAQAAPQTSTTDQDVSCFRAHTGEEPGAAPSHTEEDRREGLEDEREEREEREEFSVETLHGGEGDAGVFCPSTREGERKRRPRNRKQGVQVRHGPFSQPKWAACPCCLSSWDTSNWGSCARGFTALECVWTNSHDLRWHECLASPAAAEKTGNGARLGLSSEMEAERERPASVQEQKVRQIFLERHHGAERPQCTCCCFSFIFVTDVLWWNDCMLGNAETACRQFVLRSRFEEMDIGASRCPLQLLPLQDCSRPTLERLYRSQLQPWPSDSLVFLHREAPYVEALSDFCLSWRDSHLSRFHVDENLGPGATRRGDAHEENQLVCLRLTENGTLATEDGIVLASTVDEETVREHSLRPRSLVRCAVAGLVLSSENGATESRAEGLRVLSRVRPHMRRQADCFARIVDQFLKKKRAKEGHGDIRIPALEAGVASRTLPPFEGLLALLFPSPSSPRFDADVEVNEVESEGMAFVSESRER